MGNFSSLEQWAGRERLCFVERCAYWRGLVNRADVMKVFNVSAAQASADLTKYQELNPGALVYQMRRKRYEGAEGMVCRLHTPRMEEAIQYFLGAEINASGSQWLERGVGAEKVALLELPSRPALARAERLVFLAVLHGFRLKMKYHSRNTGKVEVRWTRPHAFGHNGYRWHVRAWCETRNGFRDFVFSRILQVDWPTEPGPLPTEDVEWNTWVTVKLQPKQTLAENQQEIVRTDYGMTEGTTEVRVRQAMEVYTRDHLLLQQKDGSVKSARVEEVP
jgi:hypothetical protein